MKILGIAFSTLFVGLIGLILSSLFLHFTVGLDGLWGLLPCLVAGMWSGEYLNSILWKREPL